MKPLQRKNARRCSRVLGNSTTEEAKRLLLHLSRMVQQRGFRQRNRHRGFNLGIDTDPLWKMYFDVTYSVSNVQRFV